MYSEVQGASSEYEVLEAVNFALRGANVPYSIQVYTGSAVGKGSDEWNGGF